jgi:hypothetical protein
LPRWLLKRGKAIRPERRWTVPDPLLRSERLTNSPPGIAGEIVALAGASVKLGHYLGSYHAAIRLPAG